MFKSKNILKLKNNYTLDNANIVINVKNNKMKYGYFYLNFKVSAISTTGTFSYNLLEVVDLLQIEKGYFTLEEIINYKVKETLSKRTNKIIKIKEIVIS